MLLHDAPGEKRCQEGSFRHITLATHRLQRILKHPALPKGVVHDFHPHPQASLSNGPHSRMRCPFSEPRYLQLSLPTSHLHEANPLTGVSLSKPGVSELSVKGHR